MADGITVQKNIVLMLAGLVFVLLVCIFVMNVFASTGTKITSGTGIILPPTIAGNLTQSQGNPVQTVQDIYIRALNNGKYDQMEISVKKGELVRLHFTADANVGCGRQLVIYGLGVRALSTNGQEDVVEFTPQDAGAYDYSCGMRMWGPGKLMVS